MFNKFSVLGNLVVLVFRRLLALIRVVKFKDYVIQIEWFISICVDAFKCLQENLGVFWFIIDHGPQIKIKVHISKAKGSKHETSNSKCWFINLNVQFNGSSLTIPRSPYHFRRPSPMICIQKFDIEIQYGGGYISITNESSQIHKQHLIFCKSLSSKDPIHGAIIIMSRLTLLKRLN